MRQFHAFYISPPLSSPILRKTRHFSTHVIKHKLCVQFFSIWTRGRDTKYTWPVTYDFSVILDIIKTYLCLIKETSYVPCKRKLYTHDQKIYI